MSENALSQNETDRRRAEVKGKLIAIAQAAGICFTGGVDHPQAQAIEELARALEELNPTPEPAAHAAMDGRWECLYSTLPLPRETTLRRLSFAKLPRTGIRVRAMLQDVERASGQYDNVVAFETVEGATPGLQVMRGIYRGDEEKPIRLRIRFESTGVAPDDGVQDGAFREALALKEDDRLEGEVSFEGWSDVTYLDEDFRLNRGQNGNLYVIRKIADTPGRV